MYQLLRNTHLVLGLVFCFFMLMYGISSVRIAHGPWFDRSPAVTEAEVTVDAGAASDGRQLALLLMRQQGLRGELGRVNPTDEGFDLVIRRPGVRHEVNYSRHTELASIRTRTVNSMEMLVALHVIGGLWHDYWLTNLWGALLGLASLGLLILGASGIYLWFKLYDERVIGSVLLIVGLGFGLTLIIFMRTV